MPLTSEDKSARANLFELAANHLDGGGLDLTDTELNNVQYVVKLLRGARDRWLQKRQ